MNFERQDEGRMPNKGRNGFGSRWGMMIVLGAFFIIAALLLFWLCDADFYITQEAAALTNEVYGISESAPSQTVQRDLETAHIWVDTSPNMAGFALPEQRACMPSVYRDIFVASLIDEVNEDGWPEDSKWNRFGNAFETDIEPTEINLCQIACYDTDKITELNYAGLIPVLEAIASDTDQNDIYVILTDLEGVLGKDYLDRLDDCFLNIFRGDRSLRIDRYMCSYSGVLHAYAGIKKNLAYGIDAVGRDAVQIENDGNYLHRQPRPFYMLTIGPSSACKRFADSVSNLYNIFYKTHDSGKISAHSDHKDDNMSSYGMHCYATYPVDSPARIETFNTNAESNIEVLKQDGSIVFDEPSNISPGFSGTAYTIINNQVHDNRNVSIQFRVQTAMSGLGDTLDLDLANELEPAYTLVNLRNSRDASPEVSTQVLHARGPRYIRVTTSRLSSDYAGFLVTASQSDENCYDVVFSVDLTKTQKATYLIDIPLICQLSNVAAPAQNVELMKPCSIPYTQAQEFALAIVRNKSTDSITYPFDKTIDLMAIISSAANAYTTAQQGRKIPIARIVFQLRVQ